MRMRTLELRHRDERAWSRAQEVLEELVRAALERGTLEELRVARLDAHAVLLVLVAPDDAALERLAPELLEPWLAASKGLEAGEPRDGEVVLVARRTPAEGDELDGLDDAARRQRFVLEVAASGMVWGLYGDTWARSPAAGGAEALPFWSSAGQAARCSTGAWEGFVPRAIERDAFVEQWLAGMDEDGIVAVLLPTPTEPGAIVGAAELGQALARAAS
ncbi:MAG: DUF2750 domain-containing protein [Myxococcales bacterium]|nr:DUF2750 domain-containing protein [Myxococcales bacterium]